MTKICYLIAAAVGLAGFIAVLNAQPNRPAEIRKHTMRELWNMLQEPFEVKDFQGELNFKEFTSRLREKLKQGGKELPILFDVESFKEENPDAPSIHENSVRFASFPSRLTCRELLRKALSQFNSQNGTFLVRPGVIEITTIANAQPEALLRQTVRARFWRRPLEDALEELYELTGVAVILDRRVGALARTPISATLTNDITLGTGLLLMTDMAGLKMLVGDNAIFVTTPALAQQFLWERANNPFLLPAFGTPSFGRGRRAAEEAQ